MKGRVTALLMAACLAMSMAACGNNESTSGAGNGGNETTAASDSGAVSESGSEAAAADNGEADEPLEDMAEIKVTILSMGPIPQGLQDVEDAVNEITEPEINTHVTLEMLEPGNYAQQINLKMSSSEPFDLMVTMPSGTAGFTTMVSQNQFMDISELLQEYGQGIIDTLGEELLQATTINGKIYGVTTYRSLVTSNYIVMRTDVLEDLGLLEKAQNMDNSGRV